MSVGGCFGIAIGGIAVGGGKMCLMALRHGVDPWFVDAQIPYGEPEPGVELAAQWFTKMGCRWVCGDPELGSVLAIAAGDLPILGRHAAELIHAQDQWAWMMTSSGIRASFTVWQAVAKNEGPDAALYVEAAVRAVAAWQFAEAVHRRATGQDGYGGVGSGYAGETNRWDLSAVTVKLDGASS